MPTDLKTLIVRHPDHALKNPHDRGLRFALYPLQMILTAKAFGVNLVDVLGPRWPCRKPPHLGLDLDATEGLIVAWRPGSHHAHRVAGQFFDIELFRRNALQGILLFRRRRHIDPLIEGSAEFGGQVSEQLAGLASGLCHHLRREQAHDDAVLIGGPDRTVALEERCARTFLAGKAEGTTAQAFDEPFEADRRLDELPLQLAGHTIDNRARDDRLADRGLLLP